MCLDAIKTWGDRGKDDLTYEGDCTKLIVGSGQVVVISCPSNMSCYEKCKLKKKIEALRNKGFLRGEVLMTRRDVEFRVRPKGLGHVSKHVLENITRAVAATGVTAQQVGDRMREFQKALANADGPYRTKSAGKSRTIGRDSSKEDGST